MTVEFKAQAESKAESKACCFTLEYGMHSNSCFLLCFLYPDYLARNLLRMMYDNIIAKHGTCELLVESDNWERMLHSNVIQQTL